MKKDPIVFEFRENQKTNLKEVDREDFFDIMYSIQKGFSGDNEISTFLCKEVIPDCTSILIDKDRNNQLDRPFIQYKIGDEVKVKEIIRYHKIIWSILDRYCK